MDYFQTLLEIRLEVSQQKYYFRPEGRDIKNRFDYQSPLISLEIKYATLLASLENKITNSAIQTINIDDIKPLRDHIDKACPELSVEVRKYLAKKFRDSLSRPVYLTRRFRDKVIEGVTWGALLGSLLLALYIILK